MILAHLWLAYFTSAYGIEFGAVDRHWFESRLEAEIERSADDTDTAWYALKNAVLAVGCRIVVSERGSFQEACKSSWKLFENALSVHTQLLYEHTSVIGVQALTVMVISHRYQKTSQNWVD